MCIRDSPKITLRTSAEVTQVKGFVGNFDVTIRQHARYVDPVSYTHLRAHETVLDLVCRLLLEKKKQKRYGRRS